MKPLFILLLITAWTSITASADWGPLPLKSLVEHSNCIVVAEFVSEETKSTSPEGYTQHANLKVTSVIKGEPPENVLVCEHVNTMICKPQFIFPSTKGTSYLLFLIGGNNQYSVFNDIYGALPISDNKVTWFTDETKLETMEERKSVELDAAIKAIKAALPATNMTTEKAIEILNKQFIFGWGALLGEEPESLVALKTLLSDPQAKEHLQTVFEKGDTVPKLYSLSALHSIDPATFEKLSKSMKQNEIARTYFGDVISEAVVSDIIEIISKGSFDRYFKPAKP